jgi:hypothetical protein
VHLVRRGNLGMHRTSGIVGVALAAAMIVVGISGALIAAARPGGFFGVPVPPEVFLAVPFFDIVAFAVLVAWAVAQRRNPQAHKRLMLFATINLVGAAVVRIPLPLIYENFPLSMFVATDLLIVPIVLWDLATRQRLHSVTIWATVVTVGLQAGRLVIAKTEPWLAFAAWLIGFVR